MDQKQNVKLEARRQGLLSSLTEWEAREQAILDRAGWQSLKAAEEAQDAEEERLRVTISLIRRAPSRMWRRRSDFSVWLSGAKFLAALRTTRT
jgi:hypothetical protein